MQKDVYVCFIDYRKAFDNKKHEPLIKLLQSLDTDTQDIKLFANLYWNQKAAVKHNGEVSELNLAQGSSGSCRFTSSIYLV